MHYLKFGISANITPFKDALLQFYYKSKNIFESELLDFLTNDVGLIRKAGFDILLSQSKGVYPIDLLQLNEQRQHRSIETLLTIPISIESTFPVFIKLRNSPYKSIKKEVIERCRSLVNAYEKFTLELLKTNLDLNDTEDKKLYKLVETDCKKLEKLIEKKKKIAEFNPYLNHKYSLNQYYHLERENHVEMSQMIEQNSGGLASFAKHIGILRGSAFKSESNPMINKLKRFETKAYIDRQYFINPDSYELNRRYFFTKNYTNGDTNS